MTKRSTGNDRRLKWGDGWIEERPRADGTIRQVARWREPDGKGGTRIVSRSFDAVSAAEAHLREVADRIASGGYIVPERLTVTELVSRWIDRGVSEWAESTTGNYRGWAKMTIYPYLGELRVSAVTPPRVQQWVDTLSDRKMSPGTIHCGIFVLRAAFKDAVRLGMVAANPTTGVRAPTKRHKRPATWTASEANRVIATVAFDAMWNAAMRLHLATGMRPGEIRALNWDDLDWSARTVLIHRTITLDSDRRPKMGETTKTGRARAVALSDSTIAALTNWRKAQLTERLASSSWPDPDAIFTSGDGRRISESGWAWHLRRIIAEAGVKRITPHGVRHTFATLALEQGTHPKIVADILGHSSIQLTLDRYSHVSVDLQRTAIASLDATLNTASNRDDVVV